LDNIFTIRILPSNTHTKMITNALIAFFVAIASFLIGLLPTLGTFGTAFDNAWNWISTWVANFLYVLPASETVLTVLTFLITLEAGILGFKIFDWILNKVRGSG